MSEYELIKDFVLDHFAHFGTYPAEVETEEAVYSFEEYWAILDGENVTKRPR